MKQNPENARSLTILLIFALLLLLSAAGFRDFHSRGEAREALVMQDMFENSSYILPKGYGGAVPSKPPLFHWLGAIASQVSSQVTELSARMPSILAALLVIVLSYRMFKSESDSSSAIFSSLIMLTSVEWLRAASSARVDMLLSACLMAAFFSIYRWQQSGYNGYPYWLPVSVCAAIMCKGPVGVVLPAMVYGIFSLMQGQKLWPTIWRGLYVFVPAVLLSASWYLAAYMSRPDEFVDKVYYENVARFLSTQEDEPHKSSALKLYASFLAGFLPWSILLLCMLPVYCRSKEFRNCFRQPLLTFQKLSSIDRFSLLVFACLLGFFSIPEGKRSVYLLPLYPFVAFWLARLFMIHNRRPDMRIYLLATKTICLLCLGIMTLVLVMIATDLQQLLGAFNSGILIKSGEIFRSTHGYLMNSDFNPGLSILSCLGLGATALTVYRRLNQENALKCLLVSLMGLYFNIQIGIQPAAVNAISAAGFADRIRPYAEESELVLSYGQEFYAISFYTGKRFARSEQTGFHAGDLLLTSERDLPGLKNKLPAQLRLVMLVHSVDSVMSYGERLNLFRIENS